MEKLLSFIPKKQGRILNVALRPGGDDALLAEVL